MKDDTSSAMLIFACHTINCFESDFEFDDAKLMYFNGIDAIFVTSLILFVHHTYEFDLQWNQLKENMEIFVSKFDLSFKYDNFSKKSCTFALDFTFGALLAALGIVKASFTLLSLAQ